MADYKTPTNLNFNFNYMSSVEHTRWQVERTFAGGHHIEHLNPECRHDVLTMFTKEFGLSCDYGPLDRGLAWNGVMFVSAINSDGSVVFTYHESVRTRVTDLIATIKIVAPQHHIKWWYMTKDGLENSSIKLRGPNPVDAFYPWMPQSLRSFAQDFMASSANVLVLVGPPGTGKTSFIRGLVRHMQFETWVTYDPKVQENEEFYVDFATPQTRGSPRAARADDDDKPEPEDQRCLVMEDADAIILPRKDGNKLMNRILNLSDGITMLPARKIIFSTNLPGLTAIDEALVRPGRCFAAIRFRDLSQAEGRRAAAAIGRECGSSKPHFTLSEALSDQYRGLEVKAIGF